MSNAAVYGLAVAALLVFAIVRSLTYEQRYHAKARKANTGRLEFLISFPKGLKLGRASYKKAMEAGPLPAIDLIMSSTTKKTFGNRHFGKLTIMTRDRENVKTVLALDFNSYGKGVRGDALKAFLGIGIFTSSGTYWRHSRNMLRPMFSRDNISRLHKVEEHTQQLLGELRRESAHGKPFNVHPYFLMMTLDTATELLFGESAGMLADPERPIYVTKDGERIDAQTLKDLLDYAGTVLAQRTQLGALYWLKSPAKFRRAARIAQELAGNIVERSRARVASGEKLAADNDYYSIVDDLVAQGDIDPVRIRDQIWNIFLAGRSTTAGLLHFAMWHLARDPDAWTRLREAVLAAFGDSPDTITFESLRQFTYMNNILNETLRLHPLVPVNARCALKDTTLPRGGGPNGDEPLLVPKGTEVVFSTYHMQRDPEYWGPDAAEWKPERWEEKRHHGWEFIPFLGGPRICLGQQVALSESAYVLIRMAQTFENVVPGAGFDRTEPEVESRVTITVKGGVNVYFTNPSA